MAPMLAPQATPESTPQGDAPGQAEPQERVSPIFPLTLTCCLPTCCCSTIAIVQDWLHCLLLCGVIASPACLVDVALELVTLKDCHYDPLCYVELFSSLVIVPTTCHLFAAIKDFDAETLQLRRLEERKIAELAAEHAALGNTYSQHVAKVAGFADEMACGRFIEKWKNLDKLLAIMDRSHRHFMPTDLFPKLKELASNWVVEIGGARFAHGVPERNPVELLLKNIKESQSIKELREKLGTGTSEILNSTIQHFWEDPPPTLSAERGDASRVTERGAFSRFCGGHVRCGASWLSCHGPGGARPNCCKKVFDRHEGLDPAFRPYTWHVLGLCTVRILSKQHRQLLGLFLMDVAVIILWVYHAEVWVAPSMVVINATCILSMLLCFEQINKAQLAHRRLEVWQNHVDSIRERKERFDAFAESRDAYEDLIGYRAVPVLEVMGAIDHLLVTNDHAVENPIQLLHAANTCVRYLQENLGSPQDMSARRLTGEWKRTVGKEIKALAADLAAMQLVAPATQEQVDQMLQSLHTGAQLALRAAPEFIEDCHVKGDDRIAGLYKLLPNVTNGGKPVYEGLVRGVPMFVFYVDAATEWKVGHSYATDSTALFKGDGADIVDVAVWRSWSQSGNAWKDARSVTVVLVASPSAAATPAARLALTAP